MVVMDEESWGSIPILASGGIWWECPICHDLKCTNSVRPPPCEACRVWMQRLIIITPASWTGASRWCAGGRRDDFGPIFSYGWFYALTFRLTYLDNNFFWCCYSCSYLDKVKMLSWVIDASYYVNHWEITHVNAALLCSVIFNITPASKVKYDWSFVLKLLIFSGTINCH
jgi:hypothetical protein